MAIFTPNSNDISISFKLITIKSTWIIIMFFMIIQMFIITYIVA